jgi:hypothetical protein
MKTFIRVSKKIGRIQIWCEDLDRIQLVEDGDELRAVVNMI